LVNKVLGEPYFPCEGNQHASVVVSSLVDIFCRVNSLDRQVVSIFIIRSSPLR